MYCVKKVTEDLTWVGANDRRLSMFEGVYSVPNGVSYNSYLLLDDKTVLFDTVDKSVSEQFMENVEHVLSGRRLDYVVIQHMEPDHSATLAELLRRHPETTVVCNKMIADMIKQFFNLDITPRALIVKEGDTLSTGRHNLTFIAAPMVHWPEVMVTYDTVDKILFSADAFGTFGALNGAIFADEVDFARDYMKEARRYYTNIVGKYGAQVQSLLKRADEVTFQTEWLDDARRYYTNIVGKYGAQVQSLLKKASGIEISLICPLHGFVWRRNLDSFINKYLLWSSYTPEESGVVIAYASIYGNTANAAEVLSAYLFDRGVRTVVYDVSVTPASDIIAACFRFSHIVFAAPTYNSGIFVTMEAFLHDLAAHSLQNRTVAFIQNGSWAPTSGKQMRAIIEPLRNTTVLNGLISVKSALKPEQAAELAALADTIAADIAEKDELRKQKEEAEAVDNAPALPCGIDNNAMFKLSYGLYVLTARSGEKDNGCIINTAVQLTDSPKTLTIAVNKANFTEQMIRESGEFNLSVLTDAVPMSVISRFGFQSGRDCSKFEGCDCVRRSANGIRYIPKYTNAYISCKVLEARDHGTHTLFVAEVTEAVVLDKSAESVTYERYLSEIKPKTAPVCSTVQKGYVCKICGYVYEGETLPADFVCPLCKHGAADFEPIG